jgi:hypothetical protein
MRPTTSRTSQHTNSGRANRREHSPSFACRVILSTADFERKIQEFRDEHFLNRDPHSFPTVHILTKLTQVWPWAMLQSPV